jgi:hypothetical protein
LLAGIVWYSLGPAPSVLNAFSLSDKLLHFGAYAATTGAFLLAAVWRPGRVGGGPFPDVAARIVLSAVVVAIALELAQGAFTSRTMDALDAIAGSLGALAGLGAWALLRRTAART